MFLLVICHYLLHSTVFIRRLCLGFSDVAARLTLLRVLCMSGGSNGLTLPRFTGIKVLRFTPVGCFPSLRVG